MVPRIISTIWDKFVILVLISIVLLMFSFSLTSYIRIFKIPSISRGFSLRNVTSGEQESATETCGSMRFSKWPLPFTALASYPGSGNTWMRYILQQATGIYTGSVYNNDDELRLNGFPGEGVTNGSVLVIKTHRALLSHRKYDKIVIIIRSPFQAYLTDFNRRRGHGHTAVVDLSEGWAGYVRRQLDTWRDFYVNWISYARVPFHVIFYEKLRENLRSELVSLLNFLEFPIYNERIDCLMERKDGDFKRQRVVEDYRDIYTSNVTKILLEHVSQVCEQYTQKYPDRHKLEDCIAWLSLQ